MADGLSQESAMQRFGKICVMFVLIAQGVWAEEQTASGSSTWDTEFDITPDDAQNNDVFNVVVIGDSIAWGTGLITEEKYSYLVAQWLAEQINRPVNVKVLAHTGAAIMEDEAESTDLFPYPTYYPEFASGTPTLMEQADMISNRDEVDLILVSGGANDVGLDSVLMVDLGLLNYWDKGSSLNDIRKKSEAIRPSMFNLLNKLLSMCPDARIVVTGYFTGITDNSKGITEIAATMRPESQENQFITDYRKLDSEKKGEVVEKSRVFYQTTSESLSTAVDEANEAMRSADSRDLPYDRAAFAPIFFPPERCYGTDQSWLWKILDDPYTGTKKINDHWFDLRQKILTDFGWYCNCELCISNPASSSESVSINSEDDLKKLCDKYRRNKLVAIGHPNAEGAKNYSESIIREINAAWPIWLQPTVQAFDISPTGPAPGASFEITYEVCSNEGSGLKQVELWRKDEQSDWQEVQRNTLVGENGPLDGLFTDTPPAPGNYWYGVHVVDNAGNWNDQMNSNTNGQPSSFEPVEVEVVGSAPPIVEAFQVTPQSLNLGESFAIDYTVSDSSGSGLSHVELWRKNETSDWQEISTNTLAGETDSVSGSLTDSPSSPGKYWYGVHVVDNTVNWNDEKNSNSKNSTSHFVPIAVEVKENSLASVGSTTQDSEANVVGKWLIIQGTGELITVYDEYGNADSFQDTGLYYAEFYNDGNYSGTNRYVSLMGLQDSIISGQNGLGGETGKWVQTGNSIRVQRENDKAYEWIIRGDTMSGFEIYSDGDKTPVFAERVSAEEIFPDGEWP